MRDALPHPHSGARRGLRAPPSIPLNPERSTMPDTPTRSASQPAASAPRHRAASARARVAAALLAGLVAVGGGGIPAHAAGARAAAVDDAVAWTVETADNAHGEDRPHFEFDVDPGEVVEDVFVVLNTGSAPLELAAYAADAFTTTAGILDLRLADDPVEDSGAWIGLDRTALTLQPGERAEIGIRIEVPDDAAPGDHPAGVVTSLRTHAAGSSLSVDRRLGIRVHLRVAGDLVPAVEVTDVVTSYAGSWNPFDGGVMTVAYTLRNTGNTRVAAIDTIAASGPFGLAALPASPESVPEVLPGSQVRVERTMPGVAALGWIGGSVVVAPSVVGLGATALAPTAADISVVAVPWSLLVAIAALVIVGGVIAVVVWARRRRPIGEQPSAPRSP